MSLGSSSDLDHMLADAGVPVLYAGTFAAAVFDQSDALSSPDTGLPLQKRTTTLLIRADALSGLDIDASITVWPAPPRRRGNETIAAWGHRARSASPGVVYHIRFFDDEDDGQIMRIYVVKDTRSPSIAAPIALPTVSIVATIAAAAENGPVSGTVTISRTGATTAALTVNLALSGTATNAVDYVSVGSSVVIPVGQSSAVVTITPIVDAEAEGNQTAIVSIATGGAYTVGSPSSATVTIADLLPVITVTATDADAAEDGPDAGEFTLTRAGSTLLDVVVNIVLSGTATNGTDYTAIPSTVTIPAGQTTATVAVTPLTDGAAESPETVVLTLASGLYTVGSPSAATVTIADLLPVVSVTATIADAAEDGPVAGEFTIARAGSTLLPIVVNFTLSGTATNGVDYVTTPETATIPAGQATVTVPITPIADALTEGDETIILTVGAGLYTVGAPDTATVTLADAVPGPEELTLSGLQALSGGTPIAGGFIVATKGATRLEIPIQNDGTYSYALPSSGSWTIMCHPPITHCMGGSEPVNYTVSVTAPTTQDFVVQLAVNSEDWQGMTSTAQMKGGTGLVASFGAGANCDFNGTVELDPAGGNTVGPKAMRYTWPQRLQGSLPLRQYCLVLDPSDPDYVPGYQTEITTYSQPRYNPPPLIGTAGCSLFFRITTKESANFRPGSEVCVPIAGVSYKFLLLNIGPGTPGRIGVYMTKAGAGTLLPAALFMDMTDRVNGTVYSNFFNLPSSGWFDEYHTYVPEILNLGTAACTVNLWIDGVVRCTLTGNFFPAGATFGGSGQAWPIELGANLNFGPEVAMTRHWREYGMYKTRPSLLRMADPAAALVGVGVVATDASAQEVGGDTGTFTFTRSGDLVGALTVNYTVSGTATNGTSYSSIGTTVVIPDGQASATVTITPIDEGLNGSSKTVILTVASGTGYVVGIPSTDTVTIFQPVLGQDIVLICHSHQGVAADATGADFIVVAVAKFGAAATPTDNYGNTYVARPEHNDGFSQRFRFFDCVNATTGPLLVVTSAGTTDLAWSAWSKVDSFDQERGAAGNPVVQPGSLTPTVAKSLVVLAEMTGGGISSPSANSGFTMLESSNRGSGYNVALFYQVQSSIVTRNPTCAISPLGSGSISCMMAVYKPKP